MDNTPQGFEDPLSDIDPIMEQAFSVGAGEYQEEDDLADNSFEPAQTPVPAPASEKNELPSLDDDLNAYVASSAPDINFDAPYAGVDSEDNTDQPTFDMDPSLPLDEESPITDDLFASETFEPAYTEPSVTIPIPSSFETAHQDALPGVGSAPSNFAPHAPSAPVQEEDSGPDLSFVEFPDLQGSAIAGQKLEDDVLSHIPVKVSVELGRSHLSLQEVYELTEGSIIELERLVGEPLDLVINGQIIAQGEVVAIDNKYGLRVKTLLSDKTVA
jgi:flagellar motor switch protein FliN